MTVEQEGGKNATVNFLGMARRLRGEEPCRNITATM